ncbi:DJ-1/PfpI family protein [Candidatus Dojkabacteria bacterium]|nr:DJ-1/PfpI family protein [Candidatus Dojkabacteria bacterium]
MSKKVLMIVAPRNYRDEEFDHPREIFEMNGYEVSVASRGIEEAMGIQGGKTEVNLDITEVEVDNYDAIIFVGGPGSSIYFDDDFAQTIARDAVTNEKVLGAICIAPSIVANAGVLKGKNVTAFASEEDNLEDKGANYTGESVTVDGKIVTADGPASAKDFGNKIVEILETEISS